MNEGFPVKLDVRIDWSELDILGIINNLHIQKYAQAARVNLLEIAGMMKMIEDKMSGPVILSTNCQFMKSLYYPGTATVYSRIEQLKNTSFSVLNLVYNDKNELISRINDIIVLVDLATKTKVLLPDKIRTKLQELRTGPHMPPAEISF